MEAFNLDGGAATLPPTETLLPNGDSHGPGSIHDRIKGLKQWPGSIIRSPSGQSTTSSNGKGKGRSVSNKKGKSRGVDGDADGDGDGDEEDGAGGGAEDGDEDEDDYVVRTGHLGNPMEEIE
jgi:peroxin-6